MKISIETKKLLSKMVLEIADIDGDGVELPLFANPKYRGLILFKNEVSFSVDGRGLAEYCMKYLPCMYRATERVICFSSGAQIKLFNVQYDTNRLMGLEINRVCNASIIGCSIAYARMISRIWTKDNLVEV